MIGQYCLNFYREIRQTVTRFHWRTMETIHTLRAAAACTLAIFIALFLQVDQPYWAGISAIVVMQPFVGNSLERALQRFAGTVAGALWGLLLVSVFVQHHFMLYLMLFLTVFIGIYTSIAITRKHQYAFLFISATALLVVLQGLSNPVANTFIHIAFFRSFEVSIGIFSGLIVSHCFFPQRAIHLLRHDIIKTTNQFGPLFDSFCQLMEQQTLQARQHFTSKVVPFRVQLDKLQSLLTVGRYEYLPASAYPNAHYDQWLALLHNLFGIMTAWHRQTYNDRSDNAFSTIRPFAQPCIEQAKRCIAHLTHCLINADDLSTVQQEIASFEHLWQALELKIRQVDQSLLSKNGNSVFQQLLTIRVIVLEMAALLNTDQPTNVKCVKRGWGHWYDSLLYYNVYYVKYAFLGACALLAVPLLWLFFGLPGFSQTAISVIAIIGMDFNQTHHKGWMRIMGCFIGMMTALLLLGLSIDGVFQLLCLIFVSSSLFLYFYFSNKQIAYAGLQATVVFLVGIIPQLTPALSLAPATERMVGIFFGVSSIILLQQLFWHFDYPARCRHALRQFNYYLYPVMAPLDNRLSNRKINDQIDSSAYGEVRTALKNLYEAQSPHFRYLRDVWHNINFLLVLSNHTACGKTAVTQSPQLLETITLLTNLLATPCYNKQEKSQRVINLYTIRRTLYQTLKQLRQNRQIDPVLKLEQHVFLNTLRQIAQAQYHNELVEIDGTQKNR